VKIADDSQRADGDVRWRRSSSERRDAIDRVGANSSAEFRLVDMRESPGLGSCTAKMCMCGAAPAEAERHAHRWQLTWPEIFVRNASASFRHSSARSA
jgi:hypothetical protein